MQDSKIFYFLRKNSVRVCFVCVFCIWISNWFISICLKISFPHWILLASLLKISWPCENRLYFGLLIYVPILILIPHCLDNNGFIIVVKSGSINPLTLFFFFKTAFSPTSSHSNSQNCFLATIVLNVYIMTYLTEA